MQLFPVHYCSVCRLPARKTSVSTPTWKSWSLTWKTLCTGCCGSLSLCFHLRVLFICFIAWEGDKGGGFFVIVTLPSIGKGSLFSS